MKRYSVNELASDTGKARQTLTKRLESVPRDEGGKLQLSDILDAFESYGAGNAGRLNLQEENAKLAKERRLELEAKRAEREGTIVGSVSLQACHDASKQLGEYFGRFVALSLGSKVHDIAEAARDDDFDRIEELGREAIYQALASSIGIGVEWKLFPEPFRTGLIAGFERAFSFREEGQAEDAVMAFGKIIDHFVQEERQAKEQNENAI